MKVSAIVTVAAAAVGAAAQAIPDGTPDCVVSWILSTPSTSSIMVTDRLPGYLREEHGWQGC